MFPINFDKAKTERFLNCLRTGSPVAGVQTVDDFAALAGACFFAIMSHGPIMRKVMAEAEGREYEEPAHPEHREAQEEEIYKDIHAAIEYYGQMTMLVADGQYDQHFEPQHKAAVSVDDKGELHVSVLSGARRQS